MSQKKVVIGLHNILKSSLCAYYVGQNMFCSNGVGTIVYIAKAYIYFS